MKRIFHLDAGRKYFSLSSIESILASMAKTGFDTLEFYFLDNQGFRFGLDDLRIETPFGTYDLSCALGDGYCQEDKCPDGTNKFLTEREVESLIRTAASYGIDLIPAMEMPGHMGAILQHFPELRYPGSGSSIDLREEKSVSFALELARKYCAWFKARGCAYFNFCADEFANDLGTMGFDRIYADGTMAYFITFVNRLSASIKSEGLIPMAFNDGFYYKDDLTRYGEIDPDVQILYWSHGWNTYFPASPLTLRQKGHKLYNAHQYYYCGAGCNWAERIARFSTYDPSIFDGNIRVEDPDGVALCVWCDRANADGPDEGAYVAKKAAKAMEAAQKAWHK